MPEIEAAQSSGRGRPMPIGVAVVVTWIEAAGILAFTVWFGLDVFPVGTPVAQRLAMALGVIIFLLVIVAALGAAARALYELRHWPRSLLVVIQVIALALGFPLARDGVLVGWLLTGAAVVVLGALLAPSTTAAIEG